MVEHTSRRPRFSIQVGQQFAAWDDIVRILREAERLGYDTAYTYDHFMAVTPFNFEVMPRFATDVMPAFR